MTLPKRYKPEPTTFVKSGDQNIPITFLPVELVEEFAVLDKMREEASDLAFRLEIIALAIRGKTSELSDSISKHLSSLAAMPRDDSGTK